MIDKSNVVKMLLYALFAISLVICLYLSYDVIEIIRSGVCAIVMIQIYNGVLISEMVKNGDKNKD